MPAAPEEHGATDEAAPRGALHRGARGGSVRHGRDVGRTEAPEAQQQGHGQDGGQEDGRQDEQDRLPDRQAEGFGQLLPGDGLAVQQAHQRLGRRAFGE